MFWSKRIKERKEKMFIIAGLGNPEDSYKNTRHNVGFDAINALADKYNIDVSVRKHRGFCGKGIINGQKVLLLKPQTFMNLSGESIRSAVDYYKADPESELIIIYDDVSLEVGQLRIRKKGSAGGHNGIKSIIGHLNTQDFPRIRIGVGEKPKEMDLADYVLGHFSKAEREEIDEAVEKVAQAIQMIVADDIQGAMNTCNMKNK